MINAENHCCTMEQAKKLLRLGVTSETLLCFGQFLADKDAFWGITNVADYLFIGNKTNEPTIATYTVAELGAMLLKETRDCHYHNPSGMWSHGNTMWQKDLSKEVGTHDLFATQAECYADRLLYLMQQYPVKYPAEFLNARLKKFYELKRTL